jgi:tetratricopeptide (TPR) repeat protein
MHLALCGFARMFCNGIGSGWRKTLAVLSLSAFWAAGSLSADTIRMTEIVRRAVDYHRQGRYPEAETAAAEALSRLASTGGSLDFDGAAGLNDLATLAYAQGELDRAEQLFQRSREAYQALAAPDDPRLASVLYNLAGVWVERGKYEQAEPLYRTALAIWDKAFGAGHARQAEVWNNLGFLYLQQGRYKEAESWLGKALVVWERGTGPSAAVYAAVALSNLAMLRRVQGGFDAAESRYKQALALEEKSFGPDHPEVAATLMSLGALHRAQGKSRLAIERYRRALAVLEKTVGAQDPLAIETREQLKELTDAVEKLGEYQILVVRTKEEAEELRRKVEAGGNLAELAARHSIDPHAPELRDELRIQLDRIGAGQVSPIFPLAGNWAIVKKISAPAPSRE